MDHATEVGLIERVLAHLDARSTHLAARGSSAEVWRYLDPAELERERAALFRKSPLVVGHASLLRAEGDFLTHDETGVPLVLVRREGDRVEGFLNVCRHRGTRLTCERHGAGKKAFVCPYHGWTYDTGGALLHVPHESGFEGLPREEMGLVKIPVERRHGLLWARPEPGGALDVGGFVGEAIGRDLDGFSLDGHVVYRPRSTRRALNWKLAIEVFLEAYHVKRVHAKSIYPIFFDNVGLFDSFAPHLRNCFPKRSIAGLRGTDPAAWRLREHGNLLYYVFPNTLLLVQPDHVSAFHVFPEGPSESTIVSATLVPEAPETDKARAYWDKNIAILDAAIEEDLAIGESIQRGLASGANAAFTFGRYEQSLGYLRDAVDTALGRPLGPGASAPDPV